MEMPDKDYPFADMRLGSAPDVDDHSGPGWLEVIYAFLTMLLMALVAYEAMLL
jgi:hypothetical protein